MYDSRLRQYAGQAGWDGIGSRVGNEDFPEKAAEYVRNGYSLFLVSPKPLDGHRFGFGATAVWMGMVKDWTEQQLMQAVEGIRQIVFSHKGRKQCFRPFFFRSGQPEPRFLPVRQRDNAILRTRGQDGGQRDEGGGRRLPVVRGSVF